MRLQSISHEGHAGLQACENARSPIEPPLQEGDETGRDCHKPRRMLTLEHPGPPQALQRPDSREAAMGLGSDVADDAVNC